MADAVLALIADPERRARLGASARQLVEERWTWEGPFLDLEKAFLAACSAAVRGDGRPGAAASFTGPLAVSPDTAS